MTRRVSEQSAIRLVPLDRENWRRAVKVLVSDEQVPFVADHRPVALVILAKSYVGVGGLEWEPLGIETTGGEMVGVLALAHADRD